MLLSIKAFRFAAVIYGLCVLYLLAAPLAFAALLALLFWRAVEWAIGRLSAPSPRRRT